MLGPKWSVSLFEGIRLGGGGVKFETGAEIGRQLGGGTEVFVQGARVNDGSEYRGLAGLRWRF